VGYGVHVDESYAYIACERGLVIADVSNLASPQQVGEYECEGLIHRVHVDVSYAYIASSNGLESITR
jgi:hypothetical protein